MKNYRALVVNLVNCMPHFVFCRIILAESEVDAVGITGADFVVSVISRICKLRWPQSLAVAITSYLKVGQLCITDASAAKIFHLHFSCFFLGGSADS
jgi:hypothetical protein